MSSRIQPAVLLPISVFVLAAAVYYCWGVGSLLGDFGGDNATYLLTARHFAGVGDLRVSAHFASVSQYPPLYPAMLALFGGGTSIPAAHAITITFLLLSIVVFHLWLRALNVHVIDAVVLPTIFLALPGTYMHALSILSENLFILFVLFALVCTTYFERSLRTVWLIAAAAGVAGAMLTRSAGIALAAAFFLYLAITRPCRRWYLLLIVVVAPSVIWSIVHQSVGPSYLESFLSKYGNDPVVALLRQMQAEIVAIFFGWARIFATSAVGLVVISALGVLALLGALYRARLRKFDGYYVFAYLVLILLWPYPAEAARFVYVIVPILLAQSWMLFVELSRSSRFGHATKMRYAVVAAVAIVSLPDVVLAARRFWTVPPVGLEEYRRQPEWYSMDLEDAKLEAAYAKALSDHMSSIATMVPPGECVFSTKPSLIGLLGSRISYTPPSMDTPDASFDSALAERNCRYVFMIGFASPSYPTPYYPLERMRGSLVIKSVTSVAGVASPVAILAERISR